MINVPLAVLTALWLSQCAAGFRRTAYALIASIGLFMANMVLADSESTLAVRHAVDELRRRADTAPVYANMRSDEAMLFFYQFVPDREIIVYGREAHDQEPIHDLSAVKNAYILVDYNTIYAALDRRPDERYPEEIFSPPAGWEEIQVVDNPATWTCYVQLNLMRWIANLPLVPQALSDRVTATIDRTLARRDLVLFYVKGE